MPPKFTWARRGGYEVSSKGDPRFSALNAVMSDGRTIEMWYQLDDGFKAWQPGGTDWTIGKGRPAKDPNVSRKALYEAYKGLWITWAREHLDLMRELYALAIANDYVLTDMFATTEINQARALSEILNEFTDGSLSTK